MIRKDSGIRDNTLNEANGQRAVTQRIWADKNKQVMSNERYKHVTSRERITLKLRCIILDTSIQTRRTPRRKRRDKNRSYRHSSSSSPFSSHRPIVHRPKPRPRRTPPAPHPVVHPIIPRAAHALAARNSTLKPALDPPAQIVVLELLRQPRHTPALPRQIFCHKPQCICVSSDINTPLSV